MKRKSLSSPGKSRMAWQREGRNAKNGQKVGERRGEGASILKQWRGPMASIESCCPGRATPGPGCSHRPLLVSLPSLPPPFQPIVEGLPRLPRPYRQAPGGNAKTSGGRQEMPRNAKTAKGRQDPPSPAVIRTEESVNRLSAPCDRPRTESGQNSTVSTLPPCQVDSKTATT